ncbi:PGF-CTERM-anchored ABC transporter substrate-binding protein [Halomarina rubra]|uniref:PGF-CTERM-anchored ABC transporter substrate-binding protein n=1 Tax=Halomarina rubra TaxID=2071873 RepID=A0ABD6ASA1_9EURY|nr:PGF-CTERM-anchored ABC transporter substrate-binding protein [Halomarina rubra]
MRRTLLVCLLVLVAVVSPATALGATVESNPVEQDSGQCSYPYSATDVTGTEVTLDEEPDRVVALGADIAQIMWEVDAEEKVVGMPVRSYTAYLNGSDSRTDVYTEDGLSVQVETVVDLEPDLVIAPDIIPNATVDQLRDAGLTVYRTGFPTSIDGIYEKTDLVGRLVGSCAEANATVSETRERVEAVRSAVEGSEQPDVLYVSSGFTAGSGTFVDEIITTAGGTNVAAEQNITGFGQLNPEVVAAANPDYILYPSGTAIPDNEAYAGTTAVQQNQTLEVDANYVSQAAPRVAVAIENVAETLHPEAFTNETTSPVENATRTEPGATTGTTSDVPATTTAETGEGGSTTTAETTSSGSGPGFGVAAALLALLATALLARRD